MATLPFTDEVDILAGWDLQAGYVDQVCNARNVLGQSTVDVRDGPNREMFVSSASSSVPLSAVGSSSRTLRRHRAVTPAEPHAKP